MAKAQEKTPSAQPDTPTVAPVGSTCPVDIQALAAELFVRNVIPRSDMIQPWKVAADCFAAAQEFARVASLIKSGVAVDELGPEIKSEPVQQPTEETKTPQAVAA